MVLVSESVNSLIWTESGREAWYHPAELGCKSLWSEMSKKCKCKELIAKDLPFSVFLWYHNTYIKAYLSQLKTVSPKEVMISDQRKVVLRDDWNEPLPNKEPTEPPSSVNVTGRLQYTS